MVVAGSVGDGVEERTHDQEIDIDGQLDEFIEVVVCFVALVVLR